MRDWDSIVGFLLPAEAELLKRYAREQQKRSSHDLLEIGSWKGRSSIAIASVLENDHRLWMVDHFHGGPERKPPKSPLYRCKYHRRGGPWAYPEAMENIIEFGVQDKVIMLPLSSQDAVHVVDEIFCFIFIDGDHNYEGVASDWGLWAPSLEIGGVVLFHDCSHPPVKRLLDALQREEKSLEVVERVKATLVFRKVK